MTTNTQSHAYSPLLSEPQWAALEVIKHLHAQIYAQLGALTESEKNNYLRLQHQYSRALLAVENEDQNLKNTFETDGIQQLKMHLFQSTGKVIDPDKTYFHTLYLHVPQTRSTRDISTEQGMEALPEAQAIRDEQAPLVHVASMSLWQAACMNFGFLAYLASFRSDSLVNASFINDRPGGDFRMGQPPENIDRTTLLDVKTFVNIARFLNLGGQLKARISTALSENGTLNSCMRRSIKTHLHFSVMELYRTSAHSQNVRDKLVKLARSLDQPRSALRIKKVMMTMEFTALELLSGSGFNPQSGFSIAKPHSPDRESTAHHINIPLYQIEQVETGTLYSFFPGRPGGELRFHTSESQLQAEFKTQYLNAHTANALSWFDRQLTPDAQRKMIQITRVPTPPTGLNPTAQWLYDVVQLVHKRQPLTALGFRTLSLSRPLESHLFEHQSSLYTHRLEHLAVEKSDVDLETLTQALLTFFEETLGVLLTPVPGALKGLTRTIRYLFLGVTAQGLLRGLDQAAKDESVELLQTLTDVLDVVLSVPLHAQLGKIALTRHMTTLNRIGNPRKITHASGRTEFWHTNLDGYVQAPAHLIAGLVGDAQGIYRHENREYVVLDKDGLQYVVEVHTREQGGKRFLVHTDATVYRPPIVFDPVTRNWHLSLDDRSALNDGQLLCRMLPGLTEEQAQPLLNISAASRQSLERAWAGDVPEGALLDTVTRFMADVRIQRMLGGLTHYQQTGLILERPLLALLPQIDYWPDDLSLKVFDDHGNLREVYAKGINLNGVIRSIDLKRLEDGELVLNGQALIQPFPPHLLSQIIDLLPSTSADSHLLPLDVTLLTQMLGLRLRNDKAGVFDSLAYHSDRVRQGREIAGLPQRVYYPLELHPPHSPSDLVLKLREFHPELSQARCIKLGEDYPALHAHLDSLIGSAAPRTSPNSRLIPDDLYDAIQRVKTQVRRERLLDAIYFSRAFNADADNWIRELGTALIKRELGLELLINPVAQDREDRVPVYQFAQNTVHLQDHGHGVYSGYNKPSFSRPDRRPDSFFNALNAELKALPRAHSTHRLYQYRASDWRRAIADELVEYRTPEGLFGMAHTELESFVHPTLQLTVEATRNKAGIYLIETTPCIVLNGNVHEVESLDRAFTNKIVHPTLFARVPVLVYGNGTGAWRHEFERPLEWQGHQLFRRLGQAEGLFNSDQIDAILQVTGITDDRLRRVHVNHEKVPPLLVDTCRRFAHVQRLQRLLSICKADPGLHVVSDIFLAFEEHDRRGITASLTTDQLHALRQSVGPGDTLHEMLINRPEHLTYAHVLYQHFSRANNVVTPSLFNLILHVSENITSPSVALIKRVFPGLPVSIAADLVSSTNERETDQLTRQGRIPLRLAEEARWYVRELRVNRALEGFYFPTLQNNDSVKLLLHSLGLQLGWPADVKIEVRENTVTGPLIGRLGSDQAGIEWRVLRTPGGWHAIASSPDIGILDGDDLFTILLAALPVTQRRALGFNFSGGDALLKEQLTLGIIERRATIFGVLGMVAQRPWFSAPQRLADGRVGYPLSGRGSSSDQFLADNELRQRYESIYPASGDGGSFRAIERMRTKGLNIDQELARLEGEARTLKHQLDAWIEQQPDFNTFDVGAYYHKHDLALVLIKAWRKEAPPVTDSMGNVLGYKLELQDWRVSTLPILTADFSHICQLTMRGMRVGAGMASGVEENINLFLSHFTSLTMLNLEDCRLARFPAAIGELSSLVELSLANNAVRLYREDQQAVARLIHLQRLNLSGCRVTGRFDVTTLTELRELNLSRTEAVIWPLGAMQLPHLIHLDLSDNNILTVPVEVFTGPLAINRGTSLLGNELATSGIHQLQVYNARTGINFGLQLEDDQPPRLAFDHGVWLHGLDADERQIRYEECQLLRGDLRAESFFKMIEELKTTADFDKVRDDLVLRVQHVLEAAIGEENVRGLLFALASKPTQCCDSIALRFSQLETQVLVGNALADDDPDRAEQSLAHIIRGNFRLKVLDSFAVEDGGRRGGIVDVLEIGFTYRLALSEALGLPAQPKNMKFPELGRVQPAEIERVKMAILAMDNGELMLDHMTHDPFWDGFLRARYADQFNAVYESNHKEVDGKDLYNVRGYEDELQTLLNRLTLAALSRLDGDN